MIKLAMRKFQVKPSFVGLFSGHRKRCERDRDSDTETGRVILRVLLANRSVCFKKRNRVAQCGSSSSERLLMG